jgi:hypothetical protein
MRIIELNCFVSKTARSNLKKEDEALFTSRYKIQNNLEFKTMENPLINPLICFVCGQYLSDNKTLVLESTKVSDKPIYKFIGEFSKFMKFQKTNG